MFECVCFLTVYVSIAMSFDRALLFFMNKLYLPSQFKHNMRRTYRSCIKRFRFFNTNLLKKYPL